MDVYDYETAEKLLESNRRFKRRKVANSTYVERSEMNEDRIKLTLHDTVILTYFKDGSILFNTGGWSSPTTLDRMNRFQKRINIYRQNNLWWADYGKATGAFYDRMISLADGTFKFDSKEYQVESKNFGYLMGRQA